MPLPSLSPRSSRTVVVALAVWLAAVGNLALWRELGRIGGSGAAALAGGLGAFVVVAAALVALLALTAWGGRWKAVWIFVALAAAVAQHFMLSYGVVMDRAMLANTRDTDLREVGELMSWAFAGNVLLVAALPTLLIVRTPVLRTPAWPQVWKNALLLGGALALLGVASFASFSRLAPLVRAHAHLRYMVNPIAPLVSAASVGLRPLLTRAPKALVPIGEGVALGPSHAAGLPPLVVVVVGETARADRFALNGYARETTPRLGALDVVSFRNVRSCGTDTRDSVPCMFSPLGRAGFEKRRAEHENLLDLLQAAGLAVLWVDNQSGCKDVCARVPTASTADLPAEQAQKLCSDGECPDEALLVGLDERIARLPAERRRRGTVVFLHQMGSHGPAYFKRSPARLKRFGPECTSTSLADCAPGTLDNAYDNTIVTTDDFLARAIDWLQARSAGRSTALLYMSDHGESLGELGIYLHGLPHAIAPEAQTHVPFIAWLGAQAAPRRAVDRACLRARRDERFSHDNFFHTVLGLVDVVSPTYRSELDVYEACRRPG